MSDKHTAAQGAPFAYAIYGIGAGKHYVREIKQIDQFDTDGDWKRDDDGLGEYWAGNTPLFRASEGQAQTSAAVPAAFVWPSPPPSKGQSHVLFDDGYAEGWAKAIDTVRAQLADSTAPGAPVESKRIGVPEKMIQWAVHNILEALEFRRDWNREAFDVLKAAFPRDAAPTAQQSPDAIEAAELQTLLVTEFACYRPTHPAGLMAWARMALLDNSPHRSSGTAQQSLTAGGGVPEGYKYRVLTDRHTTGNVTPDQFQMHGVWGRSSGWMVSIEKPVHAYMIECLPLAAAPMPQVQSEALDIERWQYAQGVEAGKPKQETA